MSRLDPARTAALKQLFASVSDDILRTLDQALTLGAADDPATFAAAGQARAEREERRVRDAVFAPLAPLCRAPPGGVDTAAMARLPFDPLPQLWRLLHRTDGEATAAAIAVVRDRDDPDAGAAAADALAALAAQRIDTHPDWAALRTRLDAVAPDASHRLARLLELSAAIRSAGERAQALARGPSLAHAAALRLAYRDAETRAPGTGALLLAAIASHLEHPWQIMRLVGAVMERPTDTAIAAIELGVFAQMVLDDIDARLAALRAFDGASGSEGGAAAAAGVFACALEVAELEQSLTLTPGGAWQRRIAQQKRDLAKTVEAKLKEAMQTLDRALPVEPAKAGGRVRGYPRVEGAFDALATQRTQGLLAFLDGVRTSAPFGGFAAVRQRIVEELDARLDQYVEDLLERLRGEAEAQDREPIRERLLFAGECLGFVREPRAAQLVRRRVAAAA